MFCIEWEGPSQPSQPMYTMENQVKWVKMYIKLLGCMISLWFIKISAIMTAMKFNYDRITLIAFLSVMEDIIKANMPHML